jgi:hypothetical protein
MKTRRCADHDGQAWAEECLTDDGDFMLPQDSTLCASYLKCQQLACGDVTGCFVAGFTPQPVTCTVRIDATTTPGQPILPCGGVTNWRTSFPALPATSCVAAVVQGTQQPPFTVGLDVNGMASATATTCPLGLVIDNIDAPYPMAVPSGKTVDIIAGEHLLRATLNVELGCPNGRPTLECRLGP